MCVFYISFCWGGGGGDGDQTFGVAIMGQEGVGGGVDHECNVGVAYYGKGR